MTKPIWKQRERDIEKEKALVEQGHHKLVARLLAQRNIPLDIAKNFVDPSYANISHPHVINDMEKAVDIFLSVIQNKGKIAVLGDYDADGIVSSSMMFELCKVFGNECSVFIPSRFKHNYGLSAKSSKDFKEKHENSIPDLLFLLDCGSNNFNEIKDLKEWGVKQIIVIDHHIISEDRASTNADCFVTWHLSENKQEMCTCGLVFQFIRGVRWKTKKVNPISFLTYAAIGTIADVSPIIGDNRIIVKNGLSGYALNSITSAGLYSLVGNDVLSKGYITQEDVSFRIAPRINATGRMDSAEKAFGLLTESDPGMADKIAKHVLTFNEDRKDIQKKAEIEAVEIISNNKEHYPHGVFVFDKSWSIGVAGIIASRLVETFYKPTIVLGFYDGAWRGSGRSIPGVNVKEILDDCKEMFITYGGHAAACGVNLKLEYLPTCNKIFNDACQRYLEKHQVPTQIIRHYDAQLKINAINEDTVQILAEKMAPYCGNMNPEPTFMIKDATIIDIDIKEYKKYTLLKFKIEKDGQVLDRYFSSFQLHSRFGYELQGMRVNVYFKMPQSIDSRFELQAVDLEVIS